MGFYLSSSLVFLFGLAVGSFLNVVIYRMPRGESVITPPSACPSCGNRLKWYHNIPLLSWIVLGGKCGFCKARISPRYPAVEILNAALWLVIFFKTGPVWYFPFVASTFSALFALSMIDFEYYAVPDILNFFALGAALVQPDFPHACLNAAIAAGGLWALAKAISLATGKEAMGGADVIVAGTMAALLGLIYFFEAIFISALLAIAPSMAARDKETMVPFVPFLAMGTLIMYLFGAEITDFVKWVIYE